MSKRLTGTDMWAKAWFQALPGKQKLLYVFLKDNCDLSGVWDTNWGQASFQIGQEVGPEDLKPLSKHFAILTNGDVFVLDFIAFQYGELNPKSRVHAAVLARLAKHRIKYPIDRVCLQYPIEYLIPCGYPSDREKDKYKDKDVVVVRGGMGGGETGVSDPDLDLKVGDQSNKAGGSMLRDRFDEILVLWPSESRQGIEPAFQAFCRYICDGEPFEAIKAGVQNYVQYVKNRRQTDFPDLKFKNISKWMLEMGWRDEYKVKSRQESHEEEIAAMGKVLEEAKAKTNMLTGGESRLTVRKQIETKGL